jgi:predicted glycoside hydrolase/deacetylase ChbG (UPF0249 family)
VVTADDFGLSPAVNTGIVEAHKAGCVTSTSLLVNAPGFIDAITRLAAAPALQVGLHLNLTVGSPVAPGQDVATLFNPRTGAFYPLPRFVRRTVAGLVRPQHVAVECAAQLDRLRTAGITAAHLDGHQHVHVLPGVWAPVLATARHTGIRAVRVPIEPLGNPFRTGAAIKQVCIRAAWRVAAAADAGADMRVAHFRGMMLQGTRQFLSRLLTLLDRLPPGVTELMVHPGYVTDDAVEMDHLAAQRELELVALCSPSLAARLARGDITVGLLGS